MAALTAFGLLTAGCSTGGTGTRDEGAARTDQGTPSTAPTPASTSSPMAKVDAVQLIKSDPKVSDQVKDDLKPCVADAFPVDTSYGNLTGTGTPDVVVNVLTCGDAVGIGTYVYRVEDEKYRNVFAVEEPAVYSTIDRGDLVVTRQVYAKGDPVAYPSGEDVLTYRWQGSKFTEHDRVHNDFSKAVGDGGIDPAEPTAPSEN
ncbi:hypothetical protein [Streptomyces sp. SP18CS02]|uniref:hypothetical protein n=1 Tax=Streptomyces sp. SP18CS02 TaxID=3002531 RepID=UPI002E79B14A|nr:hypothetical protein [Streptomyces sp. SP18CS02]MEE1756693.1 hypothetical protein [Streptomyces sp. SP18CS02]